MRRLAAIALLLLLGGCAYYNGMYNTKKLAGRARRAEREGRTFDATSLWGQVSVKAESVLAQHPNSKWADEARLLQGTSFVKLRNCAQGVVPLEQVLSRSSDPKLTEEAASLLGGCRTSMGDPAGAMAAYSRLTTSKDPERRRLALFAFGRAQRVGGNFELALTELDSTDYPGSLGERAAALSGLGRFPEAMTRIDSLIALGDSTAPWDSIYAYTSRRDSLAGSQLADHIAEAGNLPVTLRARILLADGERWRLTDSVRSEARLAQAQEMAGGTALADEARLEALRLRIRGSETIPQLRKIVEQLGAMTDAIGSAGPRAAQLAGFGGQVVLTADSVTADTPTGDLRLFLAGEMARDSLAAPRLAGAQFRRIVTEWPSSPFAPKAVLALIQLEPDQADSLRQALVARYPESPYVAFVQGDDSPQYAVLEDSLRAFAMVYRPGVRVAPPVPPRRPTAQPAPTVPKVEP